MADLQLNILDDLAVLGVRGPDALTFLQGQLSQDMTRLAGETSLLAGLHNAQGRVLALLRLLRLADDHVLLVLPEDSADDVRQLLGRFVLRAKVRIEDASSTWLAYGVSGPDAAAAASTRLAVPMDATGLRQLVVAPRGEPLPEGDREERDVWRLEDIANGLPEIGAATSGLFVAQMLNLDLLDAISFKKGCYTGQEVIARAHYRGQVKRRMQRFYTETDVPLVPGERLRLADGRNAQLVMAAPLFGGGQEFLAVTVLPSPEGGGAVDASEGFGTARGEVLACTQLPLPYGPPA
jgi:folate-binding protein YgfZ